MRLWIVLASLIYRASTSRTAGGAIVSCKDSLVAEWDGCGYGTLDSFRDYWLRATPFAFFEKQIWDVTETDECVQDAVLSYLACLRSISLCRNSLIAECDGCGHGKLDFFNAYWNRQLDFNHVEGLIQRLSEHDECVETDAYGPYQECLRLIEDGIYVTE